ncbi:amidase [Rhodococcus sp. SRB_17]|nr:amidase [Rhodococcus sp. SRB_17]
MTDFPTITEAAAALRSGDTTAKTLVEHAIVQADALDASVGVFISRYVDSARAAAADVDAKIALGEPLGPLEGIPLGIKDIIAESQGPTTAQSLVLDPAWGESIGDAVLVSRLKNAGAIVMGKLTTMEFAIGVPDVTKPFPVPRNAWNTDRWAGGSSSGSGSGVATEMFLGAIGTDTAGSIRIPAAFNGVTGLKATFGRVPKSGIAPLGYTLDHPGPMARSAADCALMLSVIAGHHASDGYSAPVGVDDYLSGLTGDLTGLRIGVDDLDRFASGGIDPNQPALFAHAVGLLEAAGAEIVPVQVPMYEEGTAIDFVVMLSEALAYHTGDLRTKWNDYGLGTRIVLAGADVVTAADYVQAQRVRRVLQQKMVELFETVDLVVTPTGHLGAPRLEVIDGLNPLGVMSSLHAAYWNPIGNPTLALPIGLSAESTPLSLTVSGPHWGEALVLRAGDAIQRRSVFHLEQSPLVDVLGSSDRRCPEAAPTHPVPPYPNPNDRNTTASQNGQGWSADPAENQAVSALQRVIGGMAQSLHSVHGARYVDPAGGFVAGK